MPDNKNHIIKPEEAIRYLEEHIPDLAEAAIKQAYWQWRFFPMVAGRSSNRCRRKPRYSPASDWK